MKSSDFFLEYCQKMSYNIRKEKQVGDTMDNYKILIIEDEKPIADILKYGFVKEGFEVFCAYTGMDGMDALNENHPDIVLLDWMLPDVDGVTVCKHITKKCNIPIVMLTAKGTIEDKLLGLESGADDYITKPFDLREVIARVKTIIRRFEKVNQEKAESENTIIEVNDMRISEIERTVKIKEGSIVLTPKEFDLLVFLVKHNREVFTRQVLLEQIWGYDFAGDTRTVDIHVQRLRKKLPLEEHLQTVFGVGYKYVS
ncbi:two-component response regulator SA14-24 [Lachnospiraceae bacterium KM106-2]|nr:two-component response regulator SA14-24 [Lachnospiraceae bacterium KM106-2]